MHMHEHACVREGTETAFSVELVTYKLLVSVRTEHKTGDIVLCGLHES
jgi:hypothetical protein